MACINSPEDDNSDSRRKNVLRPNLNHARTARLAPGKEHAKVKIVSENYESVGGRVIEDLRVRSGWLTDCGQ